MAKWLKRIDEEWFSHLEMMFNISYYIAKNSKPFADIRGLAELIDKLNVEVLEEYACSSNKHCKEFVHYIAQCVKEDDVADIKASEFVFILLDGSTDRNCHTAEVLLTHLQKLHTVRWVASKVGTITAVIQDWKSLVTHLENVGCGKDSESNKAKGILKTLKKKTMTSLEELKRNPGPMENEFLICTSETVMYNEIQLAGFVNGQNIFQYLLKHDDKKDILQKALDEWYEFKVCAKGLLSPDLLGKAMANGDRFPVFLKLLKVASVLQVSTASCERGFNQMTLVKNKLSSSLETESLDDLMLENFN
ncbi:hypothetical protein PR048_020151 [Dryococelus australis]|uniref:HAT C-terminal dimerisation domain-containing protein n=1 Tax=Dryococelus australis TaxID=614101 RepID=A0ABQ9H5H4_9NEOP|nr:hypothetical protein PR048_020151 [Dryococelus australis]